MADTLVAGLGSFYGNDIHALSLIQRLEKDLQHFPEFMFFYTNAPQDILVQMERLKNDKIKRLILIDTIENNPLCHITHLTIEDLKNRSIQLSDHMSSVYEVLSLIPVLYQPDISMDILGLPDSELTEGIITEVKKVLEGREG